MFISRQVLQFTVSELVKSLLLNTLTMRPANGPRLHMAKAALLKSTLSGSLELRFLLISRMFSADCLAVGLKMSKKML